MDALECVNRKKLAAATDRLYGEMDAMFVNEGQRSDPRLVGGLFHHRAQDDDDDQERNEKLFIKFVVDTVEKVQATL